MWVTVGSPLWAHGENERNGTYKEVNKESLKKGRMRFMRYVSYLSTRLDHPLQTILKKLQRVHLFPGICSLDLLHSTQKIQYNNTCVVLSSIPPQSPKPLLVLSAQDKTSWLFSMYFHANSIKPEGTVQANFLCVKNKFSILAPFFALKLFYKLKGRPICIKIRLLL